MAQASFGYLGVGVETTPGVSVPPTKFLPVKDVDFQVDKEFINFMEIRGSTQASQTFDGPVRPSVSFTSSFYPVGATGVILKGLIGDLDTVVGANGSAGAAGYRDHTFKDAPVLPSLSFERGDTRTSTGAMLHERLNGVKIESVGFSCAYGEDVEMSVEGQGLAFPEDPASHPASITYPPVDPMIFKGAVVKIDGVNNSFFKSIDFDFTRTLERQETLRGTNSAYSIQSGGLECSLSGTLAFEDLTLYNAFKNSTVLQIKVIFTGGVADVGLSGGPYYYEAEFTWPKVRISNHGVPMTAGEVLEADVDFQVTFDNATERMVQIRLRNLDAANHYNT